MESTGKGFIFFFVGIIIACLFAIFTANAQEIITNDTPRSEVSIVAETLVTDEVSSGDILDPTNVNIVVISEKSIVSDLKSKIRKSSDVSAIENYQEQIFDIQGEFEQVKDIVNVYESPDGFGFQVIKTLKDKIIYTGYGTNAKDYTYTVSLPVFVASSTISG